MATPAVPVTAANTCRTHFEHHTVCRRYWNGYILNLYRPAELMIHTVPSVVCGESIREQSARVEVAGDAAVAAGS